MSQALLRCLCLTGQQKPVTSLCRDRGESPNKTQQTRRVKITLLRKMRVSAESADDFHWQVLNPSQNISLVHYVPVATSTSFNSPDRPLLLSGNSWTLISKCPSLCLLMSCSKLEKWLQLAVIATRKILS